MFRSSLCVSFVPAGTAAKVRRQPRRDDGGKCSFRLSRHGRRFRCRRAFLRRAMWSGSLSRSPQMKRDAVLEPPNLLPEGHVLRGGLPDDCRQPGALVILRTSLACREGVFRSGQGSGCATRTACAPEPPPHTRSCALFETCCFLSVAKASMPCQEIGPHFTRFPSFVIKLFT